ncbi:MAG: hypothetical protein QM688_07145, partial [Sphingomonas bacterium]
MNADDAGAESRSASAVLGEIEGAFAMAVDRVATLCASGGKLDPRLLDAHQWVTYELALAHAELLAARTTLASAGRATPQDVALGLAFTAWASASSYVTHW